MNNARPVIVYAGIALSAAALAVSVIVGVAVLAGSGIRWSLGPLGELHVSAMGRPLLFALLSALALTRLAWPGRFRASFSMLSPASWLFALLLCVTIWQGLAGKDELHGDGHEYVLQTQSIVFRGELRVDPGALIDRWNATNPYGWRLEPVRPPAKALTESAQAGGGFGGLYPDRFGHYRYYHFWLYSLFVAPFYLLFHVLGSAAGLEYYAFRFVNVVMLSALFLLAWRRHPSCATLGILVFAVFSPLIPYCDWQHPELFCLFLAFLGFWAADNPRLRYVSPVFLGMAAAQNLPVVLFFPFHLALVLSGGRAGPPTRRMALLAGYAAGLAVALCPLVYCQYYFGTPNVIAAVGGASLGYASVSRAIDVFFSPMTGALFFYPACLLFLPACWARGRWPLILLACACVSGATWLSTATSNFNAGQVGPVRYAVWLLAPLWYVVLHWVPDGLSRGLRTGLYAGAGMIGILMLVYFRTYQLPGKDLRRFEGTGRAVFEVAALYRWIPYHDDAETLVENILGRELARRSAFSGIYVWDLGNNTCLWILSKDAVTRLKHLECSSRHSGSATWHVYPEQPLEVREEGGKTLVEFPPGVRFAQHPVLGGYIILRTRGPIDVIRSNVDVFVRPKNIKSYSHNGMGPGDRESSVPDASRSSRSASSDG